MKISNFQRKKNLVNKIERFGMKELVVSIKLVKYKIQVK